MTEGDRNSARIAMKLFVKDWRDYLDKSGKDVHEYTTTEHIAMLLSGKVYRVPDPLSMDMAEEACALMDMERQRRMRKGDDAVDEMLQLLGPPKLKEDLEKWASAWERS